MSSSTTTRVFLNIPKYVELEKCHSVHQAFKHNLIKTSNNHRLESAGLNALEELLRCWECTEKIVKPACVF